jgi:hypothetical protein
MSTMSLETSARPDREHSWSSEDQATYVAWRRIMLGVYGCVLAAAGLSALTMWLIGA